MVKIGIDARFYGTGTGLARYTQNVLPHLVKLLPQHQLSIFLSDPYYQQLNLSSSVTLVRCNSTHYSLSEQLVLPRLITKHRLDVWFSFHFNIPIFSSIPKITVIHDLIKTYSQGKDTTTHQLWLYQLKRWGYNLVMKQAVTTSKAIIVPSNTVKNDILAFYASQPEKIHPIWEAPDKAFQQPPKQSSLKNLANLPSQYILYVGNAYPHKNISTLFTAMTYLPKTNLVMVASQTPYLRKLISRLDSQTLARLYLYHSLKDSQLNYLYHQAQALVTPSLMEGFGLPGLEALIIGKPVIASNIAVFREIYQDKVIYFKTNSAKDLASKISSLNNYSVKPFKYTRTWQQVAQEIAEVINESCLNL